MFRSFVVAVLFSLVVVQGQIKYEAEDVIVNKEVTNKEVLLKDKWCIWSTDVNKQAWSGGVVVRSPITYEDHKTHDEGAPWLHCRLPIPEPGIYTISFHGSFRPIGLSLDGGKTWRKYTSGIIASKVKIENGFFDCWFDDCYRPDPKGSMGPAYVDYFLVTPYLEPKNGLSNGDFEALDINGKPVSWGWFHRQQLGGFSASDDAHGGKRSVRIVVPAEGTGDWALANSHLSPVVPGKSYRISGWIKSTSPTNARFELVGYRGGEQVTWVAGRSRAFYDTKGVWQQIRGIVVFDERFDGTSVRVVGRGPCDLLVDDIEITELAEDSDTVVRPKVTGHAKVRVEEPMGRGVYAQVTSEGTAYVSWRLLKSDAPDVGFDVYRIVGEKAEKLNEKPIVQTSDFTDAKVVEGAHYRVVPIGGGVAGEASLIPRASATRQGYRVFKLSDPDARVQKVAIADLNGDGEYDYIVKHPNKNVDPWNVVWYKSPGTYKIEAFLSDGTRLWTNDLGWDIEQGIWYSPYCAYDLDGDGKAEVIAKISEGDHRSEDGHVYEGPESFVVWDGMTGKEIARGPWVRRDLFGADGESAYGYASRNLMAIAYLDGKTPCLVNLRGTYNDMAAEAWQLVNGKLERVWSYDNSELSMKWYGQGAHTNYALDVDGDGRDEVVLGSAVLDDTGAPLWSTGKGHPDGVFFGKLRPDLPGLQVGYIMETRQKTGGICMADAATGKLLWELDEPTNHVDGKGQIADIDVMYPGAELAGADMQILEPGTNKRGLKRGWLLTAEGKVLEASENPTYRYGCTTLYWDADLQKEVFRGTIMDHDGSAISREGYGGLCLVADVVGDWREELLTSPADGEFRIYSTEIPAMDRRVCLMQEHNYRMRHAANAMGYSTEALLPYDPEAESPNLNLTSKAELDGNRVRLVVVASRKSGLKGRLVVTTLPGVTDDALEWDVDLKPGERRACSVLLRSSADVAGDILHAEMRTSSGPVLRGQVLVRLAKPYIKGVSMVEGESFSSQSGGEVQIRDDKPGTHGKSISHWDDEGHRLSWELAVPADGDYRLMVRYCTSMGAKRKVTVGGDDKGDVNFPNTGGFGTDALQWDHCEIRCKGLKRGKVVVEMVNVDGKGCNVDYLSLVPEKK
ncbi:MAG: hypothetical protein GX561_05890 [Lentisphaerae bacterium]|jgi:rhamnogalacturonan endolyase|nr:hypothetical protein [Lentisphaerota bacterium]